MINEEIKLFLQKFLTLTSILRILLASLWKMYALEQVYHVIRYFLFCFYLLFSLFFVVSCFLKSLYRIFQLLMHYCDKTKKHCFFLLITGSNFREYNIFKKKKKAEWKLSRSQFVIHNKILNFHD